MKKEFILSGSFLTNYTLPSWLSKLYSLISKYFNRYFALVEDPAANVYRMFFLLKIFLYSLGMPLFIS